MATVEKHRCVAGRYVIGDRDGLTGHQFEWQRWEAVTLLKLCGHSFNNF